MAYWKAKNTSCDRRVTRFVLGAFVIALAGVFIDQTTLYVPGIAASLLRYYWFRIADVFVPMGAALGTCDLWSEIRKRRAVVADWGLFALILSVTAWYASRYFTEMSDLRPESERHDRMDIVERPSTRMSEYRDWVAVCEWMKHNATSTDLTITPRGTQTFKWRTGLPEFVTRKDLPQDARSCVEWWRRIELLYGGSDEFWWENRVAQAAKDYGIRWIIVDRRTDPPRLPYELAYPSRFERNDTYLVYRVNRLGRTPLPEASPP